MKSSVLRLLILVCLMGIMFPASVMATDESPASDFAYYVRGDHIEITAYIGKNTNVVIPDYIKGKPVTVVRLGRTQYGRQEDIFTHVRKVVLPKTIVKLDDSAFGYYTMLEKVEGLENVQEIGELAFDWCTLEEVVFSKKLRKVNYSAFLNADIKNVTLPDDIEYESNALTLRSTENLKLIRGDSEATITINDNAIFSADQKTMIYLLQSMRKAYYVVPSGTENILYGAFAGNRFIDEVLFPKSVKSIDFAEDFPDYLMVDVYPDSYAEEFFTRYNNDTTYVRGTVTIRTLNDGDQDNERIETIISTILSQTINPGMTEEEKAKALHDWICENAEYDYSLSNYNSRNVLTGGAGVCDAYARAYCTLLDAVGIESRWISCATNQGSHSINAVKINNAWYYVDCTNDDEGFGHPDELFCFDQYVFDHFYYGGSTIEANDLNLYAPLRDHRMDQAVNSLQMLIQEKLNAGKTSFAVELEESQRMDDILSQALCSLMQQKDWTTEEGECQIRCETNDGQHFSCYTHTTDFLYDDLGDDTIRITGYKGSATTVVVPSVIDGKKVVELYCTFSNNKSVQNVVLPEGLVLIGDDSFANCINLETINFPATITGIGERAFYGCISLNSDILLPDGVIKINNSAFDCCYSITSVKIPSTVEEFGQGVFYSCSNLKEVNIMNGIETLPDVTFSYCQSLKTLKLPDSLKSMGHGVFAGSALVSLEIPAGVSDIEWDTFSWTDQLRSLTVQQTNSFYTTEDNILYSKDMKKLVATNGGIQTNIRIPEGVEKIGDYAFCMNDVIESVYIPASVKEIGKSAFRDCTVSSVYMEDGVTTIGDYAFSGIGTGTAWGFVFSASSHLKTIHLSQKLTEIGEGAFFGNQGLELLVFPESLTEINTRIINWPQEMYFPETVTYIEPQTFDYTYGATIIHGKAGAYAETYAQENGYEFVDESNNLVLNYKKMIVLPKSTKTNSVIWINGNPARDAEKDILWTSNQECVTVDNGVINAVSPGDAVITAKWNGLEATCEVHVPSISDNCSVSVRDLIRVGEKVETSCTVIEVLADGTEKDIYRDIANMVSWTVSDESIISIDQNGKVKGIGPGCASVIMTLPDGRSFSCELVVAGKSINYSPDEICVHNWGKGKIIKEASCTEMGEMMYICRICGDMDLEDIPSLNHDYQIVEGSAKAATCTTDGKEADQKCSRCDDVITGKVIDALGHDWSDWEVAETSTCVLEGQEVRTCKHDPSHKDYREAALLAHELTHVEGIAATCEEGGIKEYWTCSVCGGIFSNADGTAQITEADLPTQALGHTYGDWVPLDGNQHQRICAKDPKHTETAAHTWDAGKVTKEATEAETGERTFTCSACGGTKIEVIPMLDKDPITPSDAAADQASVDKSIPTIKNNKIKTTVNIKKKRMTVKFPVNAVVDNYRIQYRLAGTAAWTNAWSAGRNNYIIKGLKKYSLCEFRIAGYVKQDNGSWARSEWSESAYRYMNAVPLKTAAAGSKSITLTWTKDKKATGYQVQYAFKSNMSGAKTVTVNGKAKTKYTIKNLASKKKYYVKVRPVKKSSGKLYLGSLSKAKVVKVK